MENDNHKKDLFPGIQPLEGRWILVTVMIII